MPADAIITHIAALLWDRGAALEDLGYHHLGLRCCISVDSATPCLTPVLQWSLGLLNEVELQDAAVVWQHRGVGSKE